jgi:hypothetical protein
LDGVKGAFVVVQGKSRSCMRMIFSLNSFKESNFIYISELSTPVERIATDKRWKPQSYYKMEGEQE